MNADVRKINSRAVAAEIIGEWLEVGTFPDRMVDLVETDRAFVMEVVYGVARWKRALEWVVKRLAKRNPDREMMPFLFVGLYQILFMDRVEEYAAVHETVEAVKAADFPHTVAFVNAVLRRALREKQSVMEALSRQPPVTRLSHPDVLVDRWKKQFGMEKMLKLLDWNNSRPDVIVRPNRLKTTFDDFLKAAGAAGLIAAPHPFAPDECLSISRGTAVADVSGYREGLFSVQDPSTLVSVRVLDPQPGEFVLDACAAPGGKTALIAEKMSGKGRIVAMDIEMERLEILRENLARMGIKSVTVMQGDASSPQDMKKASDGRLFDRILLDVPCTNTGVLRRRPDARWRFSIKGLNELIETQRRILANASAYLKPGGILVYSTCSLGPEENDGITSWWLASSQGFEKIACEQLFPPDSQTDGAYACAMRKI